jgi:mono/diheme cytochrome c family protein
VTIQRVDSSYTYGMRNVPFAVAAAALVAVIATAQAPRAQAPQPPVTPAVSHAPTKAGAPPAKKPATASAATPQADHAVEAQNQLVAQYCSGCHSERGKAGGLVLAGFDASKAEQNAETAEKMIRKLRAGMMPPPTARKPDAAAVSALVTSLETRLDKAASLTSNPGWRPFQRLNRAEYGRAIHDLLGIDVDVTSFLPPDTLSSGFDNIADVQSFSPTLMEGYLRAASHISRMAVGDRTASPTSITYKIGRTQSQMRHIDGAPMGTRGGLSVVHVFPADGDYVIKASMHNEPLGGIYGRYSMLTMGITEQVDVSVDGERVALLDVSPSMSETDFGQNKGQNGLEIRTPPIHIAAGPRRVSVAFIQKIDGPVDDLVAPLENTLADVNISYGVTALPHMRDVSIVGPSTVTGVSETPSRRKIFTCRPLTPGEEETCAAQIIKNLTAQAYRGSTEADDIQDAMEFYQKGRKSGDFESGIRLALQSVLVSPRFLFRLESASAAAQTQRASTVERVGDTALASRLSFFLWDSGPDAELIKAATSGALRTPAGLDRQVRRMLADSRSESLSTRFASQWLRLQDLEKIFPDYLLYPQYDDTLAQAMIKETTMFFDSIVREDRSVLDLIDGDYTFVNERLAAHYGIPNVTGGAFRRVQQPPYRRGLLGQGSILTLTSVADRTSPVLRGKWVMDVLLGTPPPPPPPNVPALDDSVKATEGGKMLTTRQRMEEHHKNPTCAGCHRFMDPIGLSLENFDVTGAWRIKDNEMPVDVVGELYDGTKINGAEGLRDALMRHQDMVLRSFTENLLTYAIGRRVEYTDMPAVRQIVGAAAKNDNRFSAFVLGVVNSAAFRMVKAETPKPVNTGQ